MKSNFLNTMVPALVLITALSACDKLQAQPLSMSERYLKTVQFDSIDGQKEVAYKCGDEGQTPLSVIYGFKNGEVVVAHVKYRNKLFSNLLLIVEDSYGTSNEDDINFLKSYYNNNDNDNSFIGDGVTWSAAKATAENIDKVDGNRLTQEVLQTVDGIGRMLFPKTIIDSCVLDKATTAKLNKAKTPTKK